MSHSNVYKRSKEVDSIIGHVPNWIVRRGITAIFFVLLIGAALSAFIKYPDMVVGEVVIHWKKQQAVLISGQNGKLQISKENGEEVNKGDVIAWYQNEGNVEDIFFLEKSLKQGDRVYGRSLMVGSLQTTLSSYLAAFRKLEIHIESKEKFDEIGLINNQVKLLNELDKIIEVQEEILSRELNLSSQNYHTDSLLNIAGIIPDVDLRNKQIEYYRGIRVQMSNKEARINSALRVNDLERTKNNLELDYAATEKNLASELVNMSLELLAQIEDWKKKNVFLAPERGKLSYLAYLDNNSYVFPGEQLFAIIPKNKEYVARGSLPIVESGKIKSGQKVIISLDNYPRHEFGVLKGEVESISTFYDANKEEENFFIAQFKLINGLTTNYNYVISNDLLLSGQFEIVTEKISVLQRLLNWTKNKLDQP